jgi:hypothetical protein
MGNVIQFPYRRSAATNRTLRSLRKLDEAELGLEEAAKRAAKRADLLEQLSDRMAADFERIAIRSANPRGVQLFVKGSPNV